MQTGRQRLVEQLTLTTRLTNDFNVAEADDGGFQLAAVVQRDVRLALLLLGGVRLARLVLFCGCVVVMSVSLWVFSARRGFNVIVAAARECVVFLNLPWCEMLRRVTQHTRCAKAHVPRRSILRAVLDWPSVSECECRGVYRHSLRV